MSSKRPTFDLKVLDRVAQELAEAKDLKALRDLRNKAEAARQYARSAALSLRIQNYAAELRLRSERRLGELLSDLAPHGGKRTPSSQHGNLTLDELGINANQSSRWRREAAVPETVFLHYLAAANEKGREITAQGLLRLERMLTCEGNTAVKFKSGSGRDQSVEGLVSKKHRGKAISPRPKVRDEGESPGEILAELTNHRDLLARILKPLCEGADVALRVSERRMIDRLLSEIELLVQQLGRTLPSDAGRQ